MALALTSCLSYRQQDSGGAFSVTSSAFTPPSNSLLVAFCQSVNNAGSTVNANSTVTGGGLTWTKRVAADAVDSGYYQTREIWTAPVGTAASMALTWSNTQSASDNGVTMEVFALTGYDTTTPTGATASGTLPTSGAGSLTLSAAPATDSYVLASRNCESAGSSDVLATPGSGWTELYDAGQPSGTGYACMQTQYRTGSTSTSVSWASTANTGVLGSAIGGLAIEIKAAAGTTGVTLTASGQPLGVPSQSGGVAVKAGLTASQSLAVPTQSAALDPIAGLTASQQLGVPSQATNLDAVAGLTAAQQLGVPSQTANIGTPPATITAAQNLSAPSQTASLAARASATAAQTTPVPSQATSVRVAAALQGSQALGVPAQSATLVNFTGRALVADQLLDVPAGAALILAPAALQAAQGLAAPTQRLQARHTDWDAAAAPAGAWTPDATDIPAWAPVAPATGSWG